MDELGTTVTNFQLVTSQSENSYYKWVVFRKENNDASKVNRMYTTDRSINVFDRFIYLQSEKKMMKNLVFVDTDCPYSRILKMIQTDFQEPPHCFLLEFRVFFTN